MFPPTSVFCVELSAERCRATVRVNDVPVIRTPGLRPMDAVMPASHYLANGENELRLEIRGAKDGDPVPSAAEATAVLSVHETGRFEATRRVLTAVRHAGAETPPARGSTPPGRTGDSVAGPVTVTADADVARVARMVTLDAAIPRWRWLDSPVIPNDAAMQASLLDVYRQIWRRFSVRDSSGFVAAMAERTAELRAALQAGLDDIPDDRGLVATLADPALRLADLRPERAVYEPMGGGRLARYVHADGRPVIVFVEGRLGNYFDFIFRRENQRWIICR
jgi:hypothetical protein